MGRIATLSTICSILAIWAKFSLLAVAIINIRQVSANNNSSIESHQNPSMDIRIDQPAKRKTDKYIYHVDTNVSNVMLVNTTGVFTIRLDCWAPYPIDLRFYGHLTNQETTVKTFRKDYAPPDKPKSWFIINATMETYEQTTGNYTCFSVENPRLLSSYYIFVTPRIPGVLLTRGQQIRIQIKPEETRVILPCAVSHPGVSVELLKDEKNITPLEDDSYDPKVGFLLRLDLQNPSSFGNYSCRTELSPKDRANFTLVAPEKFWVEPRIHNIHIRPNNQLKISCDATDDFIIAFEPPALNVILNKVTQVENPYAYYQYRGEFVSAKLRREDAGHVYCKWRNSNRTFAYWTFAVLDKEIKPGELDSHRFNSACRNTSHLIVFECSNPVECRINSCLRKDRQCQSNGQICVSLRDEPCVKNGLIQCAVDTSSATEIFFTGFPAPHLNKTTRYVEWENATVDELLLVEQVNQSSRYKVKSDIILAQFTCQGSNFVFSSGFKWIIYFQNKTQLVVTSLKDINENNIKVTVTNSWKEKKSNLASTLSIYLNKFLTKHITFIECQAPVWNSWQWISRKIPVVITNSAVSIDFTTRLTTTVLTFLGIYWQCTNLIVYN